MNTSEMISELFGGIGDNTGVIIPVFSPEFVKLTPTEEYENRNVFDIHDVKKRINCEYFEIVRIPDSEYILIADEEGLFNNPTVNIIASRLVGMPIVGDVMLCHTSLVA